MRLQQPTDTHRPTTGVSQTHVTTGDDLVTCSLAHNAYVTPGASPWSGQGTSAPTHLGSRRPDATRALQRRMRHARVRGPSAAQHGQRARRPQPLRSATVDGDFVPHGCRRWCAEAGQLPSTRRSVGSPHAVDPLLVLRSICWKCQRLPARPSRSTLGPRAPPRARSPPCARHSSRDRPRADVHHTLTSRSPAEV